VSQPAVFPGPENIAIAEVPLTFRQFLIDEQHSSYAERPRTRNVFGQMQQREMKDAVGCYRWLTAEHYNRIVRLAGSTDSRETGIRHQTSVYGVR